MEEGALTMKSLQLEEEFRNKALAINTRRGYESDWRDFSTWCTENAVTSLPASPSTIKQYFIGRSSILAKASMTRRIAAIARTHLEAGYDSPTIDPSFRSMMRGIRKSKSAPQNAKEALLSTALIEILEQLPEDTAQGKRDRALLLIGFAGALRRSELVALDREDITVTAEGIVLTVRKSKTDQESSGVQIGIPRGRRASTCPVVQLQAWLDELGIIEGPIFRRVRKNGLIGSDRLGSHAVAEIVKRNVGHSGFQPENFSAHSLRAGLATSAALAGHSERQIMAQTRHKSERMVRVYIRKGSLFRENVAGSLGF